MPYRNQVKDFMSCLQNRRQITSTELSFICDMVRNELESRKRIYRMSNNPPLSIREILRQASCQVLETFKSKLFIRKHFSVIKLNFYFP
jgi:hypothetical protein